MTDRRQDWSPTESLRFITDAEKERLREIGRLIARDDGDPLRDEAVWLMSLVARLSALRPDEFEFPRYLACANYMEGKAYAVKFVSRTPCERPFVCLERDITATHDLFCLAHDGFVLVRPYVRADTLPDAPGAQALRRAKLDLKIDHESVLTGGALPDFLVWSDGTCDRRTQRVLHSFTNRLFTACVIDDFNQADGSRAVGHFLPNGSLIEWRLRLEDDPPKEEVRVAFGAVLALYTTKGKP